MDKRSRTGFTLVEVLVVVSLIALLVGILLPSLGRATELARRTSCRTNLKEIVRACITYAQSPQENRGTLQQALPVDWRVVPAQWYDVRSGNGRCLWILISRGYVPSTVFVCPSVSGCAAAQEDRGDFVRTAQIDQLGYSYQSMVLAGGTRGYSMLDIGPMVIIGDRNPRINRDNGSLDPAMDEANSLSHGRNQEGQNIGRLDGYVGWTTTPKVVTGTNSDDWIYRGTGNDGAGIAGITDDVYLIP